VCLHLPISALFILCRVHKVNLQEATCCKTYDNRGRNGRVCSPPQKQFSPIPDHAFNVKVMLMATPPPDELFEKTCHMAGASKSMGPTLRSLVASAAR
jgi:hypothetical protein